MKDLVDVVNVAHQVKKLLKLYYLGKYSILFKLRLKLQIWNLILYLLPELLYFSKQKKKKTEESSVTVLRRFFLPIFKNGTHAESRNKEQPVGTETCKWRAVKWTLCDTAFKRQSSRNLLIDWFCSSFWNWFRFIIFTNFFNTKTVNKLKN